MHRCGFGLLWQRSICSLFTRNIKMANEIMDTKQLAEYLSIKVPTIRKWTFTRSIPYYKLGGLVRFDKGQIDAWLKDKMVEAYDPTKYVAK
jgi:excisionase family DNA binding protein